MGIFSKALEEHGAVAKVLCRLNVVHADDHDVQYAVSVMLPTVIRTDLALEVQEFLESIEETVLTAVGAEEDMP